MCRWHLYIIIESESISSSVTACWKEVCLVPSKHKPRGLQQLYIRCTSERHSSRYKCTLRSSPARRNTVSHLSSAKILQQERGTNKEVHTESSHVTHWVCVSWKGMNFRFKGCQSSVYRDSCRSKSMKMYVCKCCGWPYGKTDSSLLTCNFFPLKGFVWITVDPIQVKEYLLRF